MWPQLFNLGMGYSHDIDIYRVVLVFEDGACVYSQADDFEFKNGLADIDFDEYQK
jgi:hypothetical protein